MTQETDKPNEGVKILGGKTKGVAQPAEPVKIVGGGNMSKGVEIIEQRRKPS